MTDIEQKALALVNEVRTEREFGLITWFDREEDMDDIDREALCRAIEQLEAEKAARAADREQHEAFRQEVSDAVEAVIRADKAGMPYTATGILSPFIIAKPDPLVEAWIEATGNTVGMEPLNEALAKRGGKIVWENSDA